MSVLRVLCLFSSAPLRETSFFARHEGHWSTEIDQGPCEFVPLVVDADMATLATSGLFAAATLLCRPGDCTPALAGALRAGAEGFARAAVPLEVVAAEGPVSVIGWLSEHAPELVGACQVDGEVKPESPSWWRERARRHLARGAGALEGADSEDLVQELKAFVAKRGW